MEPARVSSPQVDLTRYGLDKTPTLLILRCLGVDPLRPKGKEVPAEEEEEEEEERDLINDLKRYGRLAVAWNRHGSPVPRWTLTRYGPDDTPTLLALHSTGYPPPPSRESN